MSDRMTPEHALCKQGLLVATSRIAELERQRDAAVEALKRIGDLDWPGQFSVEEYANRVLREIEGES